MRELAFYSTDGTQTFSDLSVNATKISKCMYENVRLDKTIKSVSKLGREMHFFTNTKQYRLSELTKIVGF
jgi:hypothetical protein